MGSRAERNKGRGEGEQRKREGKDGKGKSQGGQSEKETTRGVGEGREWRRGRRGYERVRGGCAPSHRRAPYCQPLSAIAAGLFAPLCAIAGRSARRACPWTSG